MKMGLGISFQAYELAWHHKLPFLGKGSLVLWGAGMVALQEAHSLTMPLSTQQTQSDHLHWLRTGLGAEGDPFLTL